MQHSTNESRRTASPRSILETMTVLALLLIGFTALGPEAAAGDPCAGQGNASLQMTGDAPPAVGTITGLELTGRPFAPFILIADLGTGPAELPGIGTLCLDLSPRKRILIDSIRTGVPLIGADGSFSSGLNIPQRPNIAGLQFYMQGVIEDATAPMGYAITNSLTVDVLPSVLETFRTTDFRDDDQVSAQWLGNGRLEGIPTSPPRTATFTVPESNFNLPHPLVERGNMDTVGCRFQMLYSRERLLALPGESILGMEWSPRSDFTFASTYQDVSIRLGQMRETKPETLSWHFRANFDHRFTGSPVTMYQGDYTLANNSNAPWVPWPQFQAPFDYDNTLPLVFEFDMADGGDTYQLFRNRNTGNGRPSNRVFGDGGTLTARFGSEDTMYWTRFTLQQDRGVARSGWYSTNVPRPDYLEPFLKINSLPEGSSITVEYEGARDRDADGFPDTYSGTAFQADIDSIDGHPMVRFRVTMRANEAGEVPVLGAIALPYQPQE